MAPIIDIFQFPDELLQRIIYYLGAKDVLRLEATCRYAYSDVCRRLYWSRFRELNLVTFLRRECPVDVVSNAYRFDLASAGLIRRCGPYLDALDLSKFGPLEYGLRLGLEHAVLEHCGRLRSVDLDNRLLDRGWLVKLSEATRCSLRRLSISHVYVRNYGGLDDSLLCGELLRNWTRLETLIARDNKQLRLSSVSTKKGTITTTMKYLRSLDVRGCSVHASDVRALLDERSGCPRLQSLSVTIGPDFGQLPERLAQRILRFDVDSNAAAIGAPGAGALSSMYDHHVTMAVANMTNLRALAVDSYLVNDVFFKMVSTHLQCLEELRLPGARPGRLCSVTYALLELAALPNLLVIGLRGNPMARTLLVIAHKFKHLLEVDASYAVKERDMVDAWHDVRSPTLRTLSLRGYCSIAAAIEQQQQNKADATRRLMRTLRDTCPQLRHLIL